MKARPLSVETMPYQALAGLASNLVCMDKA